MPAPIATDAAAKDACRSPHPANPEGVSGSTRSGVDGYAEAEICRGTGRCEAPVSVVEETEFDRTCRCSRFVGRRKVASIGERGRKGPRVGLYWSIEKDDCDNDGSKAGL